MGNDGAASWPPGVGGCDWTSALIETWAGLPECSFRRNDRRRTVWRNANGTSAAIPRSGRELDRRTGRSIADGGEWTAVWAVDGLVVRVSLLLHPALGWADRGAGSSGRCDLTRKVPPGACISGLDDGWEPEPGGVVRCPGPHHRRVCRLPSTIEHMFYLSRGRRGIARPIVVLIGAKDLGRRAAFAAGPGDPRSTRSPASPNGHEGAHAPRSFARSG